MKRVEFWQVINFCQALYMADTGETGYAFCKVDRDKRLYLQDLKRFSGFSCNRIQESLRLFNKMPENKPRESGEEKTPPIKMRMNKELCRRRLNDFGYDFYSNTLADVVLPRDAGVVIGAIEDEAIVTGDYQSTLDKRINSTKQQLTEEPELGALLLCLTMSKIYQTSRVYNPLKQHANPNWKPTNLTIRESDPAYRP